MPVHSVTRSEAYAYAQKKCVICCSRRGGSGGVRSCQRGGGAPSLPLASFSSRHNHGARHLICNSPPEVTEMPMALLRVLYRHVTPCPQ